MFNYFDNKPFPKKNEAFERCKNELNNVSYILDLMGLRQCYILDNEWSKKDENHFKKILNKSERYKSIFNDYVSSGITSNYIF